MGQCGAHIQISSARSDGSSFCRLIQPPPQLMRRTARSGNGLPADSARTSSTGAGPSADSVGVGELSAEHDSSGHSIAGAAVGAVVGSGAGSAAGSVVGLAAGSVVGSPAGSAVGSVAWSAVGSVAWSTVGSGASSGAGSDATSAAVVSVGALVTSGVDDPHAAMEIAPMATSAVSRRARIRTV